MRTTFDAVNVLRWHYGMIGHPKSAKAPALEPFERAFGLALGVGDSADFECLCPVLIFNKWQPDLLVEATPEALRGRLRLATAIGIFLTDYSRLGMPWAMESVEALKRVVALTHSYTLEKDAWNDPNGYIEADGLYLEFYRTFGLYVNWPLVDFLKQYKWSMIRNEERVELMVNSMSLDRVTV
jgi:hypothetical protein